MKASLIESGLLLFIIILIGGICFLGGYTKGRNSEVTPPAKKWHEDHCYATHVILTPGNYTNLNVEVNTDNVHVSGMRDGTNITKIWQTYRPPTYLFGSFEKTNAGVLVEDFTSEFLPPEEP